MEDDYCNDVGGVREMANINTIDMAATDDVPHGNITAVVGRNDAYF